VPRQHNYEHPTNQYMTRGTYPINVCHVAYIDDGA
jgi:hypothetical protein